MKPDPAEAVEHNQVTLPPASGPGSGKAAWGRIALRFSVK